MADDLKKAVQRKGNKATFLQTLAAVSWSFFGVRKGSNHNEDMEKLNPIHVVIVAVLVVALFVTGLIVLVNVVVS